MIFAQNCDIICEKAKRTGEKQSPRMKRRRLTRMNLLRKSSVEKLDVTEVKADWERGKTTFTARMFGGGTVRFPVNFKPFSVLCAEWMAKTLGGEPANAVINTEYYRRGERLGRECGGYAVDKDNYTENKAYFFVPFGADEAYLTVTLSGGASVAFFALTVDSVGAAPCEKAIADGGMSALAPENTMPAFLAAQKAGFNAIATDVTTTADGALVCCKNLPIALADGESVLPERTDYETLKTADVGAAFNDFYKNTRVPLLGEVLNLCLSAGITPYIRISGENTSLSALSGAFCGFNGEFFVAANQKYTAKKIAEAIPRADIVRFGEDPDALTSETEQSVELVRSANSPDKLERLNKLGEQKILTSIYLV